MAHFAELDDTNTVLRVIVVSDADTLDENGNESEAVGAAFCNKLFGGRWVQTSYNNSIRARFAEIGGAYNEALDAFISPKPYDSWVFEEPTRDWVPPTPKPDDGRKYIWDEATVSWKDITDKLGAS